MRIHYLLLLAAVLVCGCEQGAKNTPAPNDPTAPSTTTPAPDIKPADPAANPATVEPTAPDNTAINARDNAPDAKTPLDQNENAADIQITADIRKRVLEQPDFSINARNVKIITADGKVTLRGPVTTEAERNAIDKIAHEIAGEKNVDSHLEVAP